MKRLIPFLLIYIGLFVYSILNATTWATDHVVSFIMTGVLWYYADRLKLTSSQFFLAGLGLLLHNFGTFGLYQYENILGYDTIVHLYGAFMAAWITWGVAPKRHRGWYVLAVVIALGVGVELIEFSGEVFLGAGEGLFRTGPGDGNIYFDVMTDILTNIIGAMLWIIPASRRP